MDMEDHEEQTHLNKLNESAYHRNIEPEDSCSNSSSSADRSTRNRNATTVQKRSWCIKGTCDQRCTGCLIAIAVLISSISIILAIFAVIKYSAVENELKTARENRGKVCLPCAPTTILMKEWKTTVTGECCVKLEELLGLLKTMIRDEVKEQFTQEVARFGERTIPQAQNSSTAYAVSAHLVLDPRSRSQGDSHWAHNAVIEWSSTRFPAHITAGLVYDKGKIVVQQSGYYYLYSQVTWNESNMTTKNEQIIATLILNVFIERPPAPESKVLSTSTMKWRPYYERDYIQQISHVGGMFFLEASSKVFVRVSQPELIKTGEPEATNFGLFKL